MVGSVARRLGKYERIILFLLPPGILFYLFRIFDINIPFISSFLNDLLFIPLIISMITVFFNRVLRVPFEPDIYKVLAAVAASGFYFEFYLPQVNTEYTGDFLDVICYFVGGAILLVIQVIGSRMNGRKLLAGTDLRFPAQKSGTRRE